MRRTGLLAVLVAGTLAACSGGDSKTASSGSASSSSLAPATSPASSTTATSSAPLSVEDEVKAAYLAYWAMVDRLFAAPDPSDPELATRAAEPLLSFVRDQLATKAAQGHRYVTPTERPNDHSVRSVRVADELATLEDCWVDGSTEVDRNGAVVDDAISTKTYRASLRLEQHGWIVTDIVKVRAIAGVSPCVG